MEDNRHTLNAKKRAEKMQHRKVYKERHDSNLDTRATKFSIRLLGKSDFTRKQAVKRLHVFKHKNNNKPDIRVTDCLGGNFLDMNVTWDDH